MFERLTDSFQDAFKNLTGRGRLTEGNIEEAMSDVRRALLEADVNYEVVKGFVGRVRDKCLGEKVLRSVAPGQQAVKIVNDELVELLGESQAPLDLSGKPSVIILVGLHGSGKTTTAAKLAMHLRDKEKQKVLLAAGDVYRPAAIEQLQVLGEELGLPVYADTATKDVPRLAAIALAEARSLGMDTLIIDTAGRHQVDTDLVQELIKLKRQVNPQEILLVADAALGQEAVSVAKHFDEALGITGVILTKLDGDARGGAALSIRQVTGRPIKFIGVGERHVDLEPFYPDRLASRILGMGDVVSLVEKAAEHIEEDEAKRLEEKLRKQTFDFEDFRDQLRRLRKMGGIMSMLDMIPGMSKLKNKIPVDERQLDRVEGIVCSMTPAERANPETLNVSRKKRIAKGCGMGVEEVNQLVKQFAMMRNMMGDMGKMEKMMGGLGDLGGLGGLGDLGGMGGMGGMGGGFGGMPGALGGRGGAPRAPDARALAEARNKSKAARAARKKQRKKNKR